MASPVVFKIRVYNPNFRSTASKNRAHIYYIAKRPGVSLNKGSSHGLFGKLNGQAFGEIRDIKAAADYAHDITKNKTNVYRGIISLKETDALRLGYENKKDWEQLLQSNIYDIAEQVGVPPSKLEYVAAVHLDKGHPHVHYLFWEREQGIKSPRVEPELANQIRIDLTKKIYKEELAELYLLKNEARDILSSETGDFFKSFFEPIKDMSEKEYKKMQKELQSNPEYALGELINTRIPPEMLDNFARKIFDLRNNLPTTGRLNSSPELNEEIEDIVHELLYYNDDFSREFESYVNTSVEIASHYTKNPKALAKAKENAEDEMIKRLSNRLLREIKGLGRKAYETHNDKIHVSDVIRIITDLFSFLSRENEAKQQQLMNTQELSKQAKKELAIKKEDASAMRWDENEMER